MDFFGCVCFSCVCVFGFRMRGGQQMERYRAFEDVAKVKAFSTLGLEQAAKTEFRASRLKSDT